MAKVHVEIPFEGLILIRSHSDANYKYHFAHRIYPEDIAYFDDEESAKYAVSHETAPTDTEILMYSFVRSE